MRKNLLAGIIGTLLIFLIAEVAIRLLGYSPFIKTKEYMLFSSDKGFNITNGVIPKDHFFARDSYLFWKLKQVPNDEFNAINLRGFRGKEISLKKPDNTYRIFCIGDSCTFGISVKYYESFPFVLENLLNQESKETRYEVVNAGIPGYSSLQGLRHLERDIIKYNPDLIISSFGWNDTMDALFYTDKEQRIPPKIIMSIHSLLQHSKVYLFLDDIISNLITKIKLSLYKNTKLSGRFVRVPEKDFVDNLTEIYKLGKLYNFKVIFLNQPAPGSTPHHYDSIIRELCKQKNIFFLDLQDEFKSSNFTSADLFLDGNHTTTLGHRLIAESIFSFSKDKGIIQK